MQNSDAKPVEDANKQKANDEMSAMMLSAPPNTVDNLSQELPLYNEDSDSDEKKQETVNYEILPLPVRKPTKDDENKTEVNADEPDNSTCICISIRYDRDGNILDYSIGENNFSDQFHDISHMGIKFDDFRKEIDGIMKDSFSKDEDALSASNAINAVKEKFPGSSTYTDTAAKTRADEWLAQQDFGNKAGKKDTADEIENNADTQDEQSALKL
ncbi:MAG: hypothetical protein QM652_04995 [Legionella sp.]|uniref:hypothetical protein n=1 Tax=Legionella sp. TaxID=459 RepID=UPI0039E58191